MNPLISQKVLEIQQLISLKYPQVSIERLDKWDPSENVDKPLKSRETVNPQNSKICSLCNSSTPVSLTSFSKDGIENLLKLLSVTELKFLAYLCLQCNSVVGELISAFSAKKELEEKVSTITSKLKAVIKIREFQEIMPPAHVENAVEDGDMDSDQSDSNSSLFTEIKRDEKEREEDGVNNQTFDDKMEEHDKFECNGCNKIFRTYIGLMMHCRKKHYLKCSYCPKKLPMKLLPQHINEFHSSLDLEYFEGFSDTDSDAESSDDEDEQMSENSDDTENDKVDESSKENCVGKKNKTRVLNLEKLKRGLNENDNRSSPATNFKKSRTSLRTKVKKNVAVICPVCEVKLDDHPSYIRHLHAAHRLLEKHITLLK